MFPNMYPNRVGSNARMLTRITQKIKMDYVGVSDNAESFLEFPIAPDKK